VFGLFGGKKKKEEAKAPAKTKAAEPVKVAPAAAAPALPAAVALIGAEQVRLRLRLVAAVKSGKTAAAYQAAKGLADIQAKAGRRLSARMWTAQADRILELDPEAA
jgi:hypothetical protein